MSTAKQQNEMAVARVAQLLNTEVDAVELSRLIRIGAFDLSIHGLDTNSHLLTNKTYDVVFYLNKIAEALHPVMDAVEA